MSAQDDLATLRLMFAHWTAKSDEDVFCPDARDVDAALSRVESRLARLEEGLRRMANHDFEHADEYAHELRDMARSLLADQGGAACGHEVWRHGVCELCGARVDK